MESLFLNSDVFLHFMHKLYYILGFIVALYLYGFYRGSTVANGAEMWKSMIKVLAYGMFFYLALFLRVDPTSGYPAVGNVIPDKISLDRAFVIVFALLEAVSSFIDIFTSIKIN